MSFNYVMIPTRGNCMVPPTEHESEIIVPIFCVLPMARYSSSVAKLINICCCIVAAKLKFKTGSGKLVLVSYNFQNLLSILAVSSNLHLKAVQFLSHWDNVEKMVTVQFV